MAATPPRPWQAAATRRLAPNMKGAEADQLDPALLAALVSPDRKERWRARQVMQQTH
eukprot:gene4413-4667_t